MLAALFVFVPEVDLAASRIFFGENGWLLARDSAWLVVPYRGLPRLGQLTVVVLAALWLLGFLKRFPRLRARRALTGFLLAGAILGPVLLVDIGFKDHSGRTRPVNTQEFGGQKRFTPAFVPADQCLKNCAFVSGHVAMASFVMAFGWLGAPAIRRRWLLGSVVAGTAMAAVRMIPGGHFLSDAIFAWFAVYYALWLTELIFRRLKWLPPHASPEFPTDE